MRFFVNHKFQSYPELNEHMDEREFSSSFNRGISTSWVKKVFKACCAYR